MIRCPWVPEGNILYQRYHDEEWGVPVHEDHKHFEFLVLEGAQAGLSWETVLKRRDGYREAFAGFDPAKVATFDNARTVELRLDDRIIRNRAKIASAVNNAQQFIKIQREFGSFDTYIWKFVGGKPIQHKLKKNSDYPVTIMEAEALSNDLKRKGFSFVGPTIIYAHMQACGLVNDHTVSCFRFNEV